MSSQIITIQDLTFAYAPHSTVVDIPAWSVATGDQVFLHGPSGSGKSTLLNLLAGILQPTDGYIDILNCKLNELSNSQRDKWRARHMGVVFQQFNLIPYLDAVSNIQLATWLAGNRHNAERSEQLLLALGIERSLHQQAAAQLSIGQQQRVAIARALINRPELLIVDEPTSALDQRNRDSFMALLLEQVTAHNSTLIFVSHDTALAERFNRVIALHDINQAGGSH